MMQNDMKEMKEMNVKLDKIPEPEPQYQGPPPEFFDGFVTWEALEKMLKGIREELRPKTPPQAIEMGMQTEALAQSVSGIFSCYLFQVSNAF
jgi:hypothetical protein